MYVLLTHMVSIIINIIAMWDFIYTRPMYNIESENTFFSIMGTYIFFPFIILSIIIFFTKNPLKWLPFNLSLSYVLFYLYYLIEKLEESGKYILPLQFGFSLVKRLVKYEKVEFIFHLHKDIKIFLGDGDLYDLIDNTEQYPDLIYKYYLWLEQQSPQCTGVPIVDYFYREIIDFYNTVPNEILIHFLVLGICYLIYYFDYPPPEIGVGAKVEGIPFRYFRSHEFYITQGIPNAANHSAVKLFLFQQMEVIDKLEIDHGVVPKKFFDEPLF